jgi:carbon-monoxide dehydrogenase medium subunit
MLAFEMERPRSLAAAVEILGNHGSRAMIKAGGTDVLVWMRKHTVHPEMLVDLSEIPELGGISFYPHKGIKIGAMATINQVAGHEDARRYYGALADACISHSDPLIRNKATVLGNICASVPSGDMIPPFAAYEALLHIYGPEGERDIPFADFITGPRKNILSPGEIVTSASLPLPKGRSSGCYLKLGRRNALDLAQVGVACVAVEGEKGREYRLACGAVAPRPVRASEAEDLLAGQSFPEGSLLEKAAKAAAAAVNPITDVRATREYRFSMVEELTKRAVSLCAGRLSDDGRPERDQGGKAS